MRKTGKWACSECFSLQVEVKEDDTNKYFQCKNCGHRGVVDTRVIEKNFMERIKKLEEG